MIRVLVLWCDANELTADNPELWIDPMPFVPRSGDSFDLSSMLDDNDPRFNSFTKKQEDNFYGLTFRVDFVSWQKDDKGYYVKLFISGE